MSGVVTASVIGAGAAIYGASEQSSAAKKAAGEQATAENNATAAQQGIYAQNQANIQPFIDQGNSAASEVSALQGLNGGNSASIMNTLQQLPGYQFANTQGLKAVQNAATERGLGVSGAAQKGAANFATNTANTYYNNLLSGLQTTEGIGANAAGGLANVGATTGANIAGTTVGAGNALAQGTVNSANALAGGATGSSNALQNAFYTNQILGQQNNNASSYNTPALVNYGGGTGPLSTAQNQNALANDFENSGGGFLNFAGGY